MWSVFTASSFVALLIFAHDVVSFPDGGIHGPFQEYGPPKASFSSEPGTMYGPPKDTMYGPPGFTPGEPLDFDSTNSSSNEASLFAPCASSNLASNKQLLLDFFQNVFGNKRVDLIDRYIAKDLINHNPMDADGRQSLLELLKGPFGQGPPFKVDFKRISAEGDLVWLHSRFPVPVLNVTYSIVDIFRINCVGMIQEHWDVLQDTNVKSPANPHPFF